MAMAITMRMVVRFLGGGLTKTKHHASTKLPGAAVYRNILCGQCTVTFHVRQPKNSEGLSVQALLFPPLQVFPFLLFSFGLCAYNGDLTMVVV